MLEYRTVRKLQGADLVAQVNENIAAGWIPLGGVSGWNTDSKSYLVQAMTRDVPLTAKAIEAIGWAWAEACAALERGEDPRTMPVPEVLALAEEALK